MILKNSWVILNSSIIKNIIAQYSIKQIDNKWEHKLIFQSAILLLLLLMTCSKNNELLINLL